MKRASLLFCMLLALLSPPALYGADTATDAVSLAERFSSEMLLTLKDMEGRSGFDGYKKERLSAKEKLSERLKTIRWSEEPGRRRASKIMKLFDEFASGEADSLAGLARLTPPADEKRIAAKKQALSALKEKMLQELTESFKRELDAMEKGKRPAYPPAPSPLEEKER